MAYMPVVIKRDLEDLTHAITITDLMTSNPDNFDEKRGFLVQSFLGKHEGFLKNFPAHAPYFDECLTAAKEATYNIFRDQSIPKGTNRLIYRLSAIDMPIGGSCQVGGRILRSVPVSEYNIRGTLPGKINVTFTPNLKIFEIDLALAPIPEIVVQQHKTEKQFADNELGGEQNHSKNDYYASSGIGYI